MHGPEHISRSLSDFCTSWGDFASVAGLVVALIGFIVTIRGVWRAKNAAQVAAEAAQQARDRVLTQSTLANFSSAIAVMEELIRLYRKKDWGIALDRHSELRRVMLELKDGGVGLSAEQQTVLQGIVQQFKTIEGQIEKHVSGRAEPKVHLLNSVVKEQIEKAHGISVTLKNR